MSHRVSTLGVFALVLALLLVPALACDPFTDLEPAPAATPTSPSAAPSLTAVPSATPTNTPSSGALLRAALLSSVYVLTPDDYGKPYSSGSGTILTPQGHILTNFHVVGDSSSGKFYNKQSLAYIGISPSELNAKPNLLYLAQVIKSDRSLDLALLRIVATKDGGALPSDLNLPTLSIGDSDKVQIGDEVSVIGFPTLGEGTVTFTKGIVSGFLDDPASAGSWIKTDTEINPGNSGGAAINQAGEFIGIPTRVQVDMRLAGKLGKIRPVNLAKPLIQQAQRDAQSPVAFTFKPWSVAPTPTVRVVTTASFSAIIFCDEVKDGKPVNPRTTFPAGTKKVTAYWTFKGMVKGQEWGRVWVENGKTIVDKRAQAWEGLESGWISYSLSDNDGMAGTYELQLYIGKTLVVKGGFTVVSSGTLVPTRAPAPTGPKASGLITSLTMAEGSKADTKEPVNPTTVFTPTSVFHAIIRTNNAPPNTRFKAMWYIVDSGGAVPSNTLLYTKEIATDGTRYVDFTLSTTTRWYVGTYRVEIYVNDALDEMQGFSVK